MAQSITGRKVSLASAPWTMHEFFAGSGLVAYGLRGMFRPVWSNDISPKKAEIYQANFPSRHFELADIKNIAGADLPYANLSWASFPCQDLSLAGAMGGIDEERSGLVWEWLRILKEMPVPPAMLLIENVAGLLSAKAGEHYTKLHYSLIKLGYKSGAMLIDASHFVPQSRPRVFVLAVRSDIEIPRRLVGDGPNWLHNKASTSLGHALPNWVWWYAEKPARRKIRLKDLIDLSLPYDKDDVLRLIPPHHMKKLNALDEGIATGYRRTRNGKQSLELRFDGVAGCLRTPEGGSSKQFVIVKKDGEAHARLLSSREAARLMGAPDSYWLPTGNNDGYKAMGDAVALPVATFLGKHLLMPLAEGIYHGQRNQSVERISSGA